MSWVDYDTSAFIGTDQPVHAGIAKTYFQDNVSSVHDNSGFDYSQTINISDNAGSTWRFFDIRLPPIPVYGQHDGFHQIDIDVDYTFNTSPAGTCYFRFFFLTGYIDFDTFIAAVDSYPSDYYDEDSSSNTTGTVSFSLTPESILKIQRNGLSLPFVVPMFGIKATGSVASVTLDMIRIRETI